MVPVTKENYSSFPCLVSAFPVTAFPVTARTKTIQVLDKCHWQGRPDGEEDTLSSQLCHLISPSVLEGVKPQLLTPNMIVMLLQLILLALDILSLLYPYPPTHSIPHPASYTPILPHPNSYTSILPYPCSLSNPHTPILILPYSSSRSQPPTPILPLPATHTTKITTEIPPSELTLNKAYHVPVKLRCV